MAISFPNRSRSYDLTRRAVRFWEYDRSMESPFFIMVDALRQMHPNLRSNSIDILRAFDDNLSASTRLPQKSMREDARVLTM